MKRLKTKRGRIGVFLVLSAFVGLCMEEAFAQQLHYWTYYEDIDSSGNYEPQDSMHVFYSDGLTLNPDSILSFSFVSGSYRYDSTEIIKYNGAGEPVSVTVFNRRLKLSKDSIFYSSVGIDSIVRYKYNYATSAWEKKRVYEYRYTGTYLNRMEEYEVGSNGATLVKVVYFEYDGSGNLKEHIVCSSVYPSSCKDTTRYFYKYSFRGSAALLDSVDGPRLKIKVLAYDPAYKLFSNDVLLYKHLHGYVKPEWATLRATYANVSKYTGKIKPTIAWLDITSYIEVVQGSAAERIEVKYEILNFPIIGPGVDKFTYYFRGENFSPPSGVGTAQQSLDIKAFIEAGNLFVVAYDNDIIVDKIEVYSIGGKKVLSKDISSGIRGVININVGHLPKGLYLVGVHTISNGKKDSRFLPVVKD
ncbi:MAG: T9SS type A sorting domain-containing protein [Chlorobi bacterium]|nr:T9SS type A sorting domain-containing protein [Chlorobiota bacterium]